MLDRVVSSIKKACRFSFYNVINTDENSIQSVDPLSIKILLGKHTYIHMQ